MCVTQHAGDLLEVLVSIGRRQCIVGSCSHPLIHHPDVGLPQSNSPPRKNVLKQIQADEAGKLRALDIRAQELLESASA